MNDALDALAGQIRAAHPGGKVLQIAGGGSKHWYGHAIRHPRGLAVEIIDMRAWQGIIDYDPSELVLRAHAGTPLTEIESVLADAGQLLAFEPPHYGDNATLGGCVAAGLSGPRRYASGAVRDVVLGAALMNGRGEVLHFGGQVVKNVAGYDVARLMAGSLGTLGPLLEVSLRTIPAPAAEVSRRFAVSRSDALRLTHEWASAGLPVTATVWHQGQLYIRLGGAQAAVRAAGARTGGEVLEDDAAFWQAVRDHRHTFFTARQAESALWRLALPTGHTFLPGVGVGDELIEWGGTQHWLHYSGDSEALRAAAVAQGGHASCYHPARTASGSDAGRSGETDDLPARFTRPAPALMAIQKRLKSVFDPDGIFNPGRCFSDF